MLGSSPNVFLSACWASLAGNFHGSKRGFIHLLLASMGVLLLCSGCAAATPSILSDEQAEPGQVLYSDDFSDPLSGWGTWSREGAVVEYHNGGLRILVNEMQYDFWSVSGKNYSDTQVEVTAKKIGGPDDNDFGIVCRYLNKDNFYMLVISSDGYYGIAKLKDGQYSMIGTDQLQYSDTIVKGQGSNHLRADCTGPVLAIYANGQKLMEAQDSDFASGDVGLLAGAYDISGVDILFDNFMVKRPGR